MATAVGVLSAAMSYGARAAAARVYLTTTPSQRAAKRSRTPTWCCAEASHLALRRSKRGRSRSNCCGSSRARARWHSGGGRAVCCGEGWRTCRCSTRVSDHDAVVACCQVSQERANELRRRLDTQHCGVASVHAQAPAATAADVHALDGTGAVDVLSAEVRDGARAAAARMSVTTNPS